jgi:hypothetical protein
VAMSVFRSSRVKGSFVCSGLTSSGVTVDARGTFSGS